MSGNFEHVSCKKQKLAVHKSKDTEGRCVVAGQHFGHYKYISCEASVGIGSIVEEML